MKFKVYQITNKVNDRVYFGTTSQPGDTRWIGGSLSHLNPDGSPNPEYSNKHLCEDILLYGKDAFEFEVLDRFETREEAVEHESDLILSCDESKRYNSARGLSSDLALVRQKRWDNQSADQRKKDPAIIAMTGEESSKKRAKTIRGGNNPKARRVLYVEGNKEFGSMTELHRYLKSIGEKIPYTKLCQMTRSEWSPPKWSHITVKNL